MPSTRSNNRTKPGAKRSLDFDDDKPSGSSHPEDNIVDLVSSPSTSTSTVTPSKKKKKNKRSLDDYFASPTKASSLSPATPSKTKTSSTAAIVTPPDTKRSKTEPKTPQQQPGEDNDFIPTYLNKNVEYHRKGETLLDPVTEKVFQLVTKHYIIPDGFENARSFGPKSGISFEQRVVSAYANDQFKPKGGNSEKVVVCTSCAEIGHPRDDCPQLL